MDRITNTINALCEHLTNDLYLPYNITFLGRGEKMLRKNIDRNEIRIVPVLEKHAQINSDWTDLMPSDYKHNFGFMFVTATVPIQNFEDEQSAFFDVPVALIASGQNNTDLKYGMRELLDATIDSLTKFKDFEATSFIDTDLDVWSPFSVDRDTLKYVYDPFFAFRINGNLRVYFQPKC
jgi:hypothetical protein